jgi:hypothetical protein
VVLVVLDVEVEEVEEVEAADVDELAGGRFVVVVFEMLVVAETVWLWSLPSRTSGTVTPAAITITAAAMPSHRPSRLFLGGPPGGP